MEAIGEGDLDAGDPPRPVHVRRLLPRLLKQLLGQTWNRIEWNGEDALCPARVEFCEHCRDDHDIGEHLRAVAMRAKPEC